MKHWVAPSILAANFGNLQADVEMVNRSQADCLHVDIMDGRFVPNISFGFPVLKSLQQHSSKPLDVHLMIIEPEKYIQQFADLGASILTVHYETCTHLHRTIHQIKDFGMQAGVALNPHTPIGLLSAILHDIDLVCLMSVNPGFGGQKFIPYTYHKVRQLKALANEYQPNLRIEIDGGVNLENAPKLLKAGANVLVAGSSVFKSANPTQSILDLKNCF